MLAFEKYVGSIPAAIHLAKAAGMIRRDMLLHKSRFSSTFNNVDLEQAVLPSFLQFVYMIEHGADGRQVPTPT